MGVHLTGPQLDSKHLSRRSMLICCAQHLHCEDIRSVFVSGNVGRPSLRVDMSRFINSLFFMNENQSLVGYIQWGVSCSPEQCAFV